VPAPSCHPPYPRKMPSDRCFHDSFSAELSASLHGRTAGLCDFAVNMITARGPSQSSRRRTRHPVALHLSRKSAPRSRIWLETVNPRLRIRGQQPPRVRAWIAPNGDFAIRFHPGAARPTCGRYDAALTSILAGRSTAAGEGARALPRPRRPKGSSGARLPTWRDSGWHSTDIATRVQCRTRAGPTRSRSNR